MTPDSWVCGCGLSHDGATPACPVCGCARPWEPDARQRAIWRGFRRLVHLGRYSEDLPETDGDTGGDTDRGRGA